MFYVFLSALFALVTWIASYAFTYLFTLYNLTTNDAIAAMVVPSLVIVTGLYGATSMRIWKILVKHYNQYKQKATVVAVEETK